MFGFSAQITQQAAEVSNKNKLTDDLYTKSWEISQGQD